MGAVLGLGSAEKKLDANDEEYVHVDVGDSLKMKQVLDETVVKVLPI